jgi:very-short-patch-repair endonuclease
LKSTFKTVRPDHWQRAKQLSSSMTAAERVLWEALRSNRLGAAFRRQHPIGPYIADFCCLTANLVIEVDGPIHNESGAQMYDFQRTGHLEAEGYRVLRFSNDDVLHRTRAVLAEIAKAIQSSSAQ